MSKVAELQKKYSTDISSIILDDLECVYVHCEKCNTLVQNPNLLSRYCNDRCQKDTKNKKASQARTDDIKKYLACKHRSQKNIDKNDYHQIGFTSLILKQFLTIAGFKNIKQVKEFNIFKDTSSLKYNNILISLNIIASK